jgi:hypothetical protein
MARAGPDDDRRPVGDLGARVDVTVVPGPRGATLRERFSPVQNRRTVACLAAALLAAGAVMTGFSLAGGGRATSLLPTTVLPNTVLYPTYLRPTGPAADSSADAYPLRCLSLLIALRDPSLMNAAFDRNLPCGHPRGPYTLIAVLTPRAGGTPGPHPTARSPRG